MTLVLRDLTVALMLAAMLFADAAPVPAQTANLTPIRVGVSGKSLGFAAWYIAEQTGIFARNGLKAEFVFLSGDAVPAGLVTGGIEATPEIETIMQAAFAGYKVKDVAVLVSRPAFEILAVDSIKDLKDLRGKTVVAATPKGAPTTLLKFVLQRAGLRPGDDVKLLFVGSIAARRTLMLSGKGDAIIMSTKDALQLKQDVANLHVLVDETRMPPSLTDGVGVASSLLTEKPDLVRRIVLSVGQANAYVRTQPAAATKIIADYASIASSGEYLTKILLGAMSPALSPTPSLYDAEARLMSIADGKPVTRDQVAATWDLSLAQSIDRELTLNSNTEHK